MSNTLVTILIVCGILIGLVSLATGIILIVRYFRTRKISMLIIGVVLTFVVPGILLCIALAIAIPFTFMVYGPPEAFRP